VQTVPVIGLPRLPDAQIFAHRAVAAAGHVTQYPIEQERLHAVLV
jgi:hypothetical protein